jgi:hypothetical protein
MTDNPYEKQHRHKKATRLADFIEESDLTALQIEKLSEQEKAILASLAGVNTPSEETWKLAIDLMRKRTVNPLAG